MEPRNASASVTEATTQMLKGQLQSPPSYYLQGRTTRPCCFYALRTRDLHFPQRHRTEVARHAGLGGARLVPRRRIHALLYVTSKGRARSGQLLRTIACRLGLGSASSAEPTSFSDCNRAVVDACRAVTQKLADSTDPDWQAFEHAGITLRSAAVQRCRQVWSERLPMLARTSRSPRRHARGTLRNHRNSQRT